MKKNDDEILLGRKIKASENTRESAWIICKIRAQWREEVMIVRCASLFMLVLARKFGGVVLSLEFFRIRESMNIYKCHAHVNIH